MSHHRFLFIIGASGVGKTTVLSQLQGLLGQDSWDFYAFDSCGVPSYEEMVGKYGGGEQWQRYQTEQWILTMAQGARVRAKGQVLEGQTRLSL